MARIMEISEVFYAPLLLQRRLGQSSVDLRFRAKFQENFISDMVHCEISASEVILGDQSHIHLLENGGISKIGCAHSKTVSRNLDGTIDINLIEATIRDPAKAMCYPTTRRIFLENTQAKLRATK
ncbi:probable low-specificity L-threonine aldolase 1 [Amborella trichopoda]|uniref:probable low-specificity L-threonine aldolase 1 n=1 Tax=Amborella trichopoda TaxID=13333 RepID=UPI0009C0FA16|nr:probable low-specificity L-threonine aldolase 1 [Amborella trichopoda]|eukprot:XP_020524282.1 probable low-specificity L-threonine aldolase 1 [Amborella trichopoda]